MNSPISSFPARSDESDFSNDEVVADLYHQLTEMTQKKDGLDFDHSFPIDATFTVIEAHTDLCGRYIEILREHSGFYGGPNGSEVFRLIERQPELADKLYSVFENRPELIAVYATLDMIDPKSVENGSTAGRANNRTSRVLYTEDASEVLELIERNKQLYRDLVEKMASADWVVAASVDGIFEIDLQRINKDFIDIAALRVVIRSIDAAQNDFPTWDLYLGSNGLINGPRGRLRDPAGFLFREKEGVDELALLHVLESQEFGSDAIKAELSKFKQDDGCGVVDFVYR